MASGHANRANRPNTWLHRPSLQREDSPCQLGAVHTTFRSKAIDPFRSALRGQADSPPRTAEQRLVTHLGSRAVKFAVMHNIVRSQIIGMC